MYRSDNSPPSDAIQSYISSSLKVSSGKSPVFTDGGLTNAPYGRGHSKYRSPNALQRRRGEDINKCNSGKFAHIIILIFYLPSFLPTGSSYFTPTQYPGLNLVLPEVADNNY